MDTEERLRIIGLALLALSKAYS